MSISTWQDDLDVALRLAEAADAITTRRFLASDLSITAKPDLTPVTEADLAVETRIREILAEVRPADAVLGEEFGGEAAFAGRQWVVDPIDGTKNYVRGVPVWATLVALLVDGVPVVGVVSAPALHRRWWAAEGAGAFVAAPGSAPRRAKVSEVANLHDASLSVSDWREGAFGERIRALESKVWRLRGYGDFYHYCLLAEGAVDLAAEPEVSLWDLAALDVLVREAGGRFTSLTGQDGPHGGSALASNGRLHGMALEALGGPGA
ncbi:histidinol-phosphatase [Segniliparus rugosus]|uniref:Histidinol-phosphatase n=1 Tax=Segniliparus rugosus (strain ATCC BAA-974 / DSM 45345 / CCUG 50838 / CIP 108380 / JCM 13579 / CDC 945) TaxID=679197 RepID=E5XNZ9_SEGRC|nr:histidinol-phosphatase [Segniliparus rugosus]EFV13938.2 histidinol-phosphate phosphatase HisN [Segniliparus rugosus ATCC BAA-974]